MYDMRKYYYLVEKSQKGPFSIEELKEKQLTRDTFIWYEGLDNWIRIRDNSDLAEKLNVMSIPPPIPNEKDFHIAKTEVSGEIKVTTNKENNKLLQFLRLSKKQLAYYIIWVCCHISIFVLTKTGIDFFSDKYPALDKFWPFTNFYAEKSYDSFLTYDCQTEYGEPCFYGIFADYDISELLVYTIVPIIIFILYRLLDERSEKRNPA